MRIIDLTHDIKENMPVYPGTEPPCLKVANDYIQNGFKETKISIFSHTGTHIDPPSHIFPDGMTLDEFPIDQFVGRGLVIDCRSLGEGELITRDALLPYGDRLKKADFLLFNLGWDKLWGTPDYFGDYPVLDLEVLDLIIKGDYKGIGFDVIGLDPISDASLVRHRRLFSRRNIINIENLASLDMVGNELFDFVCLPLKLEGSDGAPCRAIAITEK